MQDPTSCQTAYQEISITPASYTSSVILPFSLYSVRGLDQSSLELCGGYDAYLEEYGSRCINPALLEVGEDSDTWEAYPLADGSISPSNEPDELNLTPSDSHDSEVSAPEGLRGILVEDAQRSHSVTFRTHQAGTLRLQDEVWMERQEAIAVQLELTRVKRLLAATESELKLSQELAQTRGDELAVAQVFMSTGDRYCGADVSRVVEKLNEAIDQCAGMIAGVVLETKASKRSCNGEQQEATCRKWMTEKWGDYLARRIVVDVARGDGVLFESMLRNMFVVWCDDFISAVSMDNPDQDEALKMLWGDISKLHGTVVANSWLSIAYSGFKMQQIDPRSAMKDLRSFLAAIGWRPGRDRSRLLSQVYDKLTRIAESAATVKEMIFQGITSARVRTLYHPQQAPYSAFEMEDSYGLGRADLSALTDIHVVLTTGLGVECTTVHDPASNQLPKKGRNVLLKSRVLLSSTLPMEFVEIE